MDRDLDMNTLVVVGLAFDIDSIEKFLAQCKVCIVLSLTVMFC